MENKMTEETNVNTQEELVKQFQTYLEENQKFTNKKVKAAAGRARKALQEVAKLVKQRRKEITEEKAALSAK
jgi:N-glycosylase/DNA lyase